MEVNWTKNKALLMEGTKAAVSAFLKKNSKEQLCAIGYVFELGNASPQFDLCADTKSARNARGESGEEDRWNSGNYPFPAGLMSYQELGKEWEAEVEQLHELASEEDPEKSVYDGLIRISCEVLAALAASGFFGNWQDLDFNVSEVNDSPDEVHDRNELIRKDASRLEKAK